MGFGDPVGNLVQATALSKMLSSEVSHFNEHMTSHQ